MSVIDFTGGEPLLHRELDSFLKVAKSNGFITTVTTNTLLYPKRAESLKGLIDMLHFSINSPDEEEHDTSRGVKCFDKFVESVEIARKLGGKPDILFTVQSNNIHRIEEIYEKFCLPNKFMLVLNPIFEYNEVGSSLSEEDIKELNRWGREKWVYINKAFLTLRKNGGNQLYDPVCRAASSTVVISPENKLVLPCYHLGLEEIPIEGQLFELYKRKEVQESIALEGKHPKCQSCVINCYMNPSFAMEVRPYWFDAIGSTLKYFYRKKIFGKYLLNRVSRLT